MTDHPELRALVATYEGEAPEINTLVAALLADRDALAAQVAAMDVGHCSGCGENVIVFCGWCDED